MSKYLFLVVTSFCALGFADPTSREVIERHEKRLKSEIEVVEARQKKDAYVRPWMKDEDKTRLEIKRASLELVRQAATKVRLEKIETLRDIYRVARAAAEEKEGKRVPGERRLDPDRIYKFSKVPPLGRDLGLRGDIDGGIDVEELMQLMRRRILRRRILPLETDVQDFFKSVGAERKAVKDLPPSIDLSAQFQAPRIQGKSLACAAFAIVSDMETFKDVPSLSVGLAYAFATTNFDSIKYRNLQEYLMAETETKTVADLHRAVDRGVTSMESAIGQLEKHAIAPEKNHPFDATNFIPKDVNAIEKRLYAPKGFSQIEGIDTNVVRQLLAGGVAPLLTIDTDARYIYEDWIVPAEGGTIGHVVNVLGYGEAANPLDGTMTKYFLVRDSLAPRAIHYKISDKDLASHLEGAIKLRGVRVLDRAVEYDRWRP